MEGESGAWAVPIPPRPRRVAPAKALLHLTAVPAWERASEAPGTNSRLPGKIGPRPHTGDPRRGKPGPGSPETAAAPPRPARVPGQRAPGGAAATSRGHRGRGPSVRPSPGARPRPPQLSPASVPTAASHPLAAHLPGRCRRRRHRCRSYHRISRDFAPPPCLPSSRLKARSPSWKLQVAPSRLPEVYTLLPFSHPASALAPDPEKLKPRCEAARSRRALTWLPRGACAAGLRSWELFGCCLSSGCSQSDRWSVSAGYPSKQTAHAASLSAFLPPPHSRRRLQRTSRPACGVGAFLMPHPHL